MEIVRRHIEAFNEGDAEASLSFVDAYFVLDRSRVSDPDASAVYGQEGLDKAIRRYKGAFEEYAYRLDRLTDLGSGAVLAVVTEAGRGKGSGVSVQRSFAALYTVIDHKIARITVFPTEESALEAAGLRE